MGRALLHPSRKGIVTVERPESDVLNLAVSSLMGALVATIRLPFPGRPTVVPLVMELQKHRPKDSRYAQRDGAL